MPKKSEKPNKYIAPSFSWVRVQKPEYFKIYGEFIVTSRYLMGLLVEHWNKTQGKNYTIEQFRFNPNDQDNKGKSETPAATTPA